MESKKVCLRCGTDKDITRDHVVARFVLRTSLDEDQYAAFSRISGKRLNKQPLCRTCNQEKGHQNIDYRGLETAQKLMDILSEEFGVDIDIEVIVEDED